jgi:hypothetical protein
VSLITAAVCLPGKLLCASIQLRIEPHDATPPICDHFIRIAAIWQNALYLMLNRSSCVHPQCAICSLPPYRIHAYLRKQLGLWDPNHSRTLRNVCKRTVTSKLNTSSVDIYMLDTPRQVQPTARNAITLQTVQRGTRKAINCSVAIGLGRTDNVFGAYSENCGLIVVWLMGLGKLFGPPLWWFHRWRMRVCVGAQSLAWCMVCYCCAL